MTCFIHSCWTCWPDVSGLQVINCHVCKVSKNTVGCAVIFHVQTSLLQSNILDKRNSNTSGARRCLRAVVWLFFSHIIPSLCACVCVCVYACACNCFCLHVCLYAYAQRCGFIMSLVCRCRHTIVIKAHGKRASYWPHNEHCNVSKTLTHTHTHTSLIFTSTHLSPGI